MSENKKFSYKITEKRNGWSAEIVRQVSAKRTAISKRQMGFETEAEAVAWAEKELPAFIELQAERNKRKSSQRNNEE